MDSVHDFWNATTTFADQLSEVGFGALLIAIGFQVANLVLRATAWRNILIAALPGAARCGGARSPGRTWPVPA